MDTTQTAPAESPIVHKFQIAGLGTAPYRYTGHKVLKYQACHGAPIQPGGSCDYCGTAIMDAFYFRSADGREFKVGSDCVYKAGDRGMVDLIKKAAAKIQTERRHAREAEQIEAIRAQMANPAVRGALAAQPHPGATGEPGDWTNSMSLLDWADWMIKNAGTAGRLKVGKAIKKAIT